jgi:hypothetical protein
MARGSDRMRRHGGVDDLPVTPLALVAFGAIAVAVGVAVPFHALTVGLTDVVTGQVAFTSVTSLPFVTGLALCAGGVVALCYGVLLLVFH